MFNFKRKRRNERGVMNDTGGQVGILSRTRGERLIRADLRKKAEQIDARVERHGKVPPNRKKNESQNHNRLEFIPHKD